MNRIEERLNHLVQKKEKAFITYMTAGLPDMEKTKEIIKAQEEAGVDIIELGVPFSDPIADGPVIQRASYQSIQKGTNITKIFSMMQELRKDCNIPIVFMLYYNTILHYGLEPFVNQCILTGVDGFIIPDLPIEEQGEIKKFLQEEKAPILIQLISPVSKKRIPKILEDARGFVYCISSMGVTGQQDGFYKNVEDYLKEVKSISKIPVMMGFGIKTPKDVEKEISTIDGAIVGSHFIQLMEKTDYSIETVKEYCSNFKNELQKIIKQ